MGITFFSVFRSILNSIDFSSIVAIVAAFTTCAYTVHSTNKTTRMSYKTKYLETVFASKREAAYGFIQAVNEYDFSTALDYNEVELACQKLLLYVESETGNELLLYLKTLEQRRQIMANWKSGHAFDVAFSSCDQKILLNTDLSNRFAHIVSLLNQEFTQH